ncbi:hypothetical protein LCL89_12745 [Halobacillus yeomjeoni]|uniref:hypothetical protein n=1 Tax=Halobacillus yeomjeoni TaxID=311194 RepID=UPI001CD429DB|nr:hypothetical protein [Halobacillus yeomjeoni]MCA0984916.1 hypothetical protein [Halobacillus yeomjeoni]
MRHDIRPNERAYSTKEVAEEVGIATPTVRKYGQILERNGYEFFKEGDRRIFVQSDIDALIAIRDTAQPKDDTAKELVEQQQERLSSTETTSVAAPDTYDTALQDSAKLHEFLKFLSSELAASREMNAQLSNDITQLKTTVSRLQQDHHVISAGVGNMAQKTNTKIDKLTARQEAQYEELLEQEKLKSDMLQQELQAMREEQKREWQSQNEFNKRLEGKVKNSKGTWDWLRSLFSK